jgi:outer membrane cobalamin receptor
VHAQPDAERVVVVGSRLPSEGFGPKNVVVRDAGAIERAAPADAEQLLRGLPGVALFRPGGAGGVSEIFVRGAESNFTAVYLDGVRLNDTTNTRGGSFDFSTLPAFRIGRLELAPGAMSAVYGADAMAGVLHIETAWPAPGDFGAQAEVGSQSDWRAGVGSTFEFANGLELGLIGAAADAGDEIEGSTLESAELGARLLTRGRGDAGGWTVFARFAERDRTSFPEVSGGPLYAVLSGLESSESQQASFSAARRFGFSADWTAELTVSRAESKEDFRSPPVAPGVLDGQPAFATKTAFDRTEVLFVNRYRMSAALQAVFGADLVMEDGRDDGSIDLGGFILPAAYELERDVRSVFAELGRSFGAGFDAALAIRADGAAGDNEVSGKLNVSKELARLDGRLWATAANGFKLPSFFALGKPLSGNPDLAPEQVASVEIGFEHAPAQRSSYGVSIFANAYEDLIDFDFETFTSVNRAQVDIDGVQAHFAYAMNDALAVSLDMTVLSIETGDGSATLPRRPEKTARLSVERALGQSWFFTGSVQHVGRRTVSSIPTGIVDDGSYALADVTLRKRADGGLAYWVAIDNLFDTEYMHAPGFPAPGARIRMGAEIGY